MKKKVYSSLDDAVAALPRAERGPGRVPVAPVGLLRAVRGILRARVDRRRQRDREPRDGYR